MNRQSLIEYISSFTNIPANEVSNDLELQLNSLALARFRNGLKRKFGVVIPQGTSLSLGKILALSDESERSGESSEPKPRISVGRPSNSAVGIDVEKVEEFRNTDDPQSDPLYRSLFSAAEMGYCLLQSDPAQHFAARFSAKEALKKCDPAFVNREFNEVEVINLPDGSPRFRMVSTGEYLEDISLSISHTCDLSIAVAVKSLGMTESREGSTRVAASPTVVSTPNIHTKATTAPNRRVNMVTVVLFLLIIVGFGVDFYR